MMGLACARASALIDRRQQGLSSADALRLEEHLERCEGCARESTLLQGLRGLSQALPEALPQAQRERAIEAALAQADARHGARDDGHAAGRARARSGTRHARTALALAVAAAAALVVGRAWNAKPRQDAVPVAAAYDHVLQGAIEVDGLPSDGASLPARVSLHARRAATVALGHARVAMQAGTTLRWDRDQMRVQLERGALTADVDPSAHQRFSVQTARFTVVVLGTRFSVTEDAVRVERGVVRVLGPEGSMLVPALVAGQRFSATPSTTASAPVVEPAAPASAIVRRNSAPRARTLLGQARAQLAAGDTTGARGTIDAAIAAAHSRSDRAEAWSLRAERALVAGDLVGAIEGYLRVSRDYAGLPSGQNALFAAARLQAERGQTAAAKELLERYLTRYPRGRFVLEARRRLSELAPEGRAAP